MSVAKLFFSFGEPTRCQASVIGGKLRVLDMCLRRPYSDAHEHEPEARQGWNVSCDCKLIVLVLVATAVDIDVTWSMGHQIWKLEHRHKEQMETKQSQRPHDVRGICTNIPYRRTVTVEPYLRQTASNPGLGP